MLGTKLKLIEFSTQKSCIRFDIYSLLNEMSRLRKISCNQSFARIIRIQIKDMPKRFIDDFRIVIHFEKSPSVISKILTSVAAP